MPDDFGSVTVTPPAAPVRDERRIKELLVRMNKAIPAIEAVEAVEADEEAGIEAVEAVAAVAAIPAGIKVAEIEIRYTNFSSANEKTDANPNGVVSQGGANLYKGAKANAIKVAIFKPGTKDEIDARLSEDNIDE